MPLGAAQAVRAEVVTRSRRVAFRLFTTLSQPLLALKTSRNTSHKALQDILRCERTNLANWQLRRGTQEYACTTTLFEALVTHESTLLSLEQPLE